MCVFYFRKIVQKFVLFLYDSYVKKNPINRAEKEDFLVNILVFTFQLHQIFSDWCKKRFNLVLLRQKYTRKNAVLSKVV